ncbi:Hsp33 family molecular chaperone HslO|uniref:33 kDa chaperonin n=1 Tax=Dendrosporobacter quercicolus TaxID=146817 RepID=A0A1G9M226_9FIRM|nr:Hsp33 family molecular chaperone HslO [Dendrosporobacter quercicolus]NSL46890.1 Hsp33 family molecular chaperone HslO [Dendrosporobacter quercicolus DSM 1736]SDL68332.1 molecular chaperone Hsp33 [Dendrosporobacter quercicolus]
MDDHIITATAPGFRAFAAVTTKLAEEARRRHQCYPVAAAALGRTMTAALLMAATFKTAETITIKIAGQGPLGEIVADATADGTVRGYVHQPLIDLPLKDGKLDVGGAVGEGAIYVTRFTGLKQPFTGSAPLVSGEIAEDVTNYLLVSEQTPSSVGLGVLVSPELHVLAAGGFLIQALPDAADDAIGLLEKNLAVLAPVSQMAADGAAEMITQVFRGMPVTFYEKKPLAFQCQCSVEKITKVLISLGAAELTEMIEEGQAEVVCHFCNEKYQFSRPKLQEILQDIQSKKPQGT